MRIRNPQLKIKDVIIRIILRVSKFKFFTQVNISFQWYAKIKTF